MNFIRNIKEGLKDPKKKSLTLLGIYAVFFIFVFILIKMGDSSSHTPSIIEEEKTNDVLSYEYSYKIYDNENILEILGTYKNKKDIFNYNGLNYTKENDIVYFNNEPIEIDFDIDKYKYNMIELLIDSSDSKTTYKDSNKTVYNITLDKYFSLLEENSDCESIDCTIINIPITIEQDEFINYVLIDLSNFYGYKYNIEIKYSNINNVI